MKKLEENMDYKIFWSEESLSNYHPNLRKAVLSKQITIFYKIQGNIIYLAYIFVNKKDIRKVK
jgi:hypothetical protein